MTTPNGSPEPEKKPRPRRAPRADRGATPLTQYRLDDETLEDLDLAAEYHRLGSRAATIRFLAGREARDIRAARPRHRTTP